MSDEKELEEQKKIADKMFGITPEEYDKYLKNLNIPVRKSQQRLPTAIGQLYGRYGSEPSDQDKRLSQGIHGTFIVDECQASVKECEHDPIDVGFSRTKIVCRKCDKDL